MPNGGLLQSCFICKWGQKEENIELRGRRLFCQRHAMEIVNPMFTFCTDLSRFNEDEQPGQLVRDHHLIGDDMYIWIENGYTSKDYPGLPQYYHDIARLCSIAEYRAWSIEQRRSAAQGVQQRHEQEFRAKYSIPAMPEWQGRALAWVMKLLHRIFN
jgi:hypothetical protein